MRKLFTVLAVVFVGLCLACGKPTGTPGVGRRVYSHEELFKLTYHKSRDEVRAMFGQPDFIYYWPGTTKAESYIYRNILQAPEGSVDAKIIFGSDVHAWKVEASH